MECLPEETERVSLRDVLFIIFSKMHVLIGIFILVVAVTMAVAFLSDPVYQVDASVLVKPVVESNVKLQTPTPTFLSVNPVSQQDINSEIEIMRSPGLLREIVRKLELEKAPPPVNLLSRFQRATAETVTGMMAAIGFSKPVAPAEKALLRLQKDLIIEPATISNVINVSLKGSSPDRITEILNTLLESYVDYHIDLYRVKLGNAFFSGQRELYAEKLSAAERALADFKGQWSIIDITVQNEANVKLLGLLNENLALTQAKIMEQQEKIRTQKASLAAAGKIEAVTQEYRSDVIQEYVKVLAPLLTERARIVSSYRETSPRYKTITEQIEQLTANLNNMTASILKGSELDLQALLSFEDSLKAQISDLEQRATLLSRKEIAYERLVREVAQNEKNLILYLDKAEEARIEEQKQAARVSNVSIVNRAVVPYLPKFPKKGLMLVLSIIVGLVAGVGGAFGAYYLDHTVKTPGALFRYAKVPVVGSLPQMPAAGNRRETLWMEAPARFPAVLGGLQNLKHNLLSAGRSGAPRTILLTGANAGVGTSTLAANLAMVVAGGFADRRVLLVDANAEAASLHGIFGESGDTGLMDYLTADATLSEIIRPAGNKPAPDLVFFGKRPAGIMSPFDLERFSAFLDEVRENYDFILFDTAPVLHSSHTRILCGKVDGTVAVTAANQTRLEVVSNMVSQLERDGAPVLGTVLNKRKWVIPGMIYRRV